MDTHTTTSTGLGYDTLSRVEPLGARARPWRSQRCTQVSLAFGMGLVGILGLMASRSHASNEVALMVAAGVRGTLGLGSRTSPTTTTPKRVVPLVPPPSQRVWPLRFPHTRQALGTDTTEANKHVLTSPDSVHPYIHHRPTTDSGTYLGAHERWFKLGPVKWFLAYLAMAVMAVSAWAHHATAKRAPLADFEGVEVEANTTVMGPSSHPRVAMAAVSGERIVVEADADAVGRTLCAKVEAAAVSAIKERGHFTLAIPGGSILKMLAGLSGKSSIDWSKVTMAYVNHRAVPLDDSTSTHYKAQPLFLKSWEEQGLNVLTLSGTTDAPHEAELYTKALATSSVISKSASGLPEFDMMLVGMGTDGHVGSVYPGTPAVTATEPVISVVKPASSSISLSLPVMLAAKEIIIATAGTSEKYPLGKSEAMLRAIQAPESVDTFPAAAFRGQCLWILDKGAASELTL